MGIFTKLTFMDSVKLHGGSVLNGRYNRNTTSKRYKFNTCRTVKTNLYYPPYFARNADFIAATRIHWCVVSISCNFKCKSASDGWCVLRWRGRGAVA